MVKSTTRGRPREFDRQQALCKALEVFWSLGFEQTTICALASAMEISSPSIYCAFGNKADLFVEALVHYRKTFWQPVFERYTQEPDIYKGTHDLFAQSAHILLSPNAPCGCLTVMTAMSPPRGEDKIAISVSQMRMETKKMFRERLKTAIKSGQIPADSNIPAISGALVNFFEGLSLQARGDICLSELLEIAAMATNLLPPRSVDTTYI